MEDDVVLPDDLEELQTYIEQLETKVLTLTGSIADEDLKMERYRVGRDHDLS